VDELNSAWSAALQARLELVGWETHAFPGVGDDAQDVINKQVPDDYDVFLGMMWSRFGTPTGRAGSGTEEEFERAMTNNGLRRTRVMVYFKDAPLRPSQIDPAQLEKLQAFTASLPDRGVFHWTFKSEDEFVKLTRLHLTKQMQELAAVEVAPLREPTLESIGQGKRIALADDTGEEEGGGRDEEESEDGLLELSETLEHEFELTGEAATKIGAIINALTEATSGHSKAMKSISANPNASRQEAKDAINAAASTMEETTAQLRLELVKLQTHVANGLKAAAGMAMLAKYLPRQQVTESVESMIGLREGMKSGRRGIAGMRDTVSGLPRLTSKLNKSRRGLVAVLEELMEVLDESDRVAAETISQFQASHSGDEIPSTKEE
jgi:hypothetical protein